jgi:hypothetical protein
MPNRRIRVVLFVFLLLAVAGCTGEPTNGEPTNREPTHRSSLGGDSARPAPAPAQFVPPKERTSAGDSSPGEHRLSALAAQDDVVVAVGTTVVNGLVAPLVLVSRDAGESWRPAELPVADSTSGEAMHAVAATASGFVAMGSGEDGRPAVWTSAEGSAWSRTETDPRVFTPRDSVTELRAFGSRFYAVGERDRRTDSAPQTPVLWTSDDGARWQRSDVFADARARVEGDPYVEDVVVDGDSMVVLGGVEDDRISVQPNRIAIWRSVNDGRTFHRDPTPLDLAGDFRAYVTDVAVVDGEIHALCMGDGADHRGDASWDGVVLHGSFRHRTWRLESAPSALGTQREDVPTTLDRVQDTWVVGLGEQATPGKVFVATGTTLDALKAVTPQGARGPGDHAINDGLAVGDAVVLVGETTSAGKSHALVWRTEDGVPRRVPLPHVTASPGVDVVDVSSRAGHAVAVGAVDGRATAWVTDDWETWEPQRLDVGASPGASYGLVVRSVGSDWLAAGLVNRGKGSKLVLWRAGGSHTFARVAGYDVGNDYATVVAQALLRRDHTLVLLTTLRYSGSQDVLPLVSTDSGRTWSRGRGRALELGVPLDGVRPLEHALRGPVNGSLQALDGVGTRRGFVAVGASATGSRAQAVAWTSSDGRVWEEPRPLPTPPGAWATSAFHVVRTGDVIVAAGMLVDGPDQAVPGWVSWTSTDGGGTWRVGRPPARRQARAGSLVRVPNGWMVMGSVGPSADTEAAAWWSEDGLRWRRLDLDLSRGAGPGDQWLGHATVFGDRLQFVATDTDARRGAPVYAASLSLAQLIP